MPSKTPAEDDPGALAAAAEVQTGYLRDFISGERIRATPEEVDAVQVFAKRLVQDYGYEYVVTFLREHTTIRGIVSMPEALFKTSGKGGTHAKVCVVFAEKTPPKGEHGIFMADAKWCGHDSRGNPTIRVDGAGNEVLLDDVPKIALRYKELAGAE